jgi:lipopolysaccharide biosynthesis regulator YciM
MINQNPQKSNNTTIYLNIFGMSTKHDVYFTNTNLKINIFTGKISLINHLEEIKSECIDKLVPPVKNDNDLLNVCINDLKNSSAQFLMSTKTDKILKKTFFNKYEYKKRVKYFINTVFNNILSNNKKKKIFDIIDYDFKKSYSISLKTLVTKPQKIETDDDCLICLEKLNSKSCFKLPCCHKYIHKNCLFSCEEYDCRCPNCRQNWYNT